MDAKPLSISSRPYGLNLSDAVKAARPDIIITIEDTLAPEIMTDLVFEDIGGQEIISIARNDIVNGQNVLYQPIKNTGSLFYQYNSQNVIPLQKTDKEYFKNFSINLDVHIPECGSGFDLVSGTQVPNCKHVYIDPITKNLVINVVKIQAGQEVEVQIIANTDVADDTIY